jgi:hypothetical protein
VQLVAFSLSTARSSLKEGQTYVDSIVQLYPSSVSAIEKATGSAAVWQLWGWSGSTVTTTPQKLGMFAACKMPQKSFVRIDHIAHVASPSHCIRSSALFYRNLAASTGYSILGLTGLTIEAWQRTASHKVKNWLHIELLDRRFRQLGSKMLFAIS